MLLRRDHNSLRFFLFIFGLQIRRADFGGSTQDQEFFVFVFAGFQDVRV